jgi:hypothetical protein
MDDLRLDFASIAPWFGDVTETEYLLVRLSDEAVLLLAERLASTIRHCYVTDARIRDRVRATGVTAAEVVAAVLPDEGATMSGEFGEVLSYVFLANRKQPVPVLGPKKWRLKQDRRKPAPFSDVIQFCLPTWPVASAQDGIVCAEVKTKATQGTFRPIAKALEHSKKDQTSRLAETLVWLRERAVTTGLDDVTIDHLDRFINATAHPASQKEFVAIAVLSADLAEDELVTVPGARDPQTELVVIIVPNLRDTYMLAFAGALRALP